MRLSTAVSLAALAAMIPMAVIGCSLITGPDRTFVIEVDSLVAPTTISVGESLRVQAFGMIGPNLCFALDRVDSHMSPRDGAEPATLQLKFYGKDRSSPGSGCPSAVADLRWEQVYPPADWSRGVRIVVHQPEGTLDHHVAFAEE